MLTSLSVWPWCLVPSTLSPVRYLLQAVVRTLQETSSAVAKISAPSSSRGPRSTDEAAQEEEVSGEWLESLHSRKKELQEKRQSRQLKRQEMSQRRSAASHKRMMIISQLADNTSSRAYCSGRGPSWCVVLVECVACTSLFVVSPTGLKEAFAVSRVFIVARSVY